MSKAKKPGTDLAALKARLAKKTKGADSAPAPAVDVPPPGHVAQPEVPPPGEVMAPPAHEVPPPGEVAQQPVAEVPPPGEQYTPPAQQYPAPGEQYPAPGEQYQAQPEPQYQAPPEPQYQAPPQQAAPVGDADDPFGGNHGGGGFDPDAGMIDGGADIAPRGSKGLVVFAALLAAGIGGVAGFLGNKIMGTRERVDAGAAKGAQMFKEVEAVSDLRKSISVKWDETMELIAKDPKAGGEAVTQLLIDSFEKHPQVDVLFGWQLASVHPVGIKKTFALYEETHRLKTDLGVLAGFLENQAGALTAAGGPTAFGVVFKSDGAVMAQVLAPLCGEIPEQPEGTPEGDAPPPAPKVDLEKLKPCEDPSKAIAFKAGVSVKGEAQESVVLRGYGKGEMQPLLPEGGIYTYAVGMEPNKNSLKIRDSLLKRIKERLEEMNKIEKIALKALENYADSPTVSGDNAQPDPGGGEDGEG